MAHRTRHSRFLVGVCIIFLCSIGTSRAETPRAFDPDLPFTRALGMVTLRALVNHALELAEDHVEMSGTLERGQREGGHHGRVEVRVYPKGKSRSGEHVAAEAWFRTFSDSAKQEFHLRLQRSPRTGSPIPEDVY